MKSKDKSAKENESTEEVKEVNLTPEEQIESLKSEIENSNEQIMRVAADFDNFRKRVERDREQQTLRVKGEVVSRFLEVIDTIDKAQESSYPDLESSLEGISGIKKLERDYQLDKPKGVRGRSSNNDLVKKVLNWSYNIKLKDGLQKTYDWISSEMQKEGVNISRFTKS